MRRRNPDAGIHRRSSLLPTPHTMVGDRGEVVEPRSESAELLRVYRLLEGGNVERAKQLVMRLYEQVRQGYHRNPSLVIFGNPPGKTLRGPIEVCGPMSREAHAILYRHVEDNKAYRHDFENPTTLLAIERDGKREVLITSPDGEPIWQDF